MSIQKTLQKAEPLGWFDENMRPVNKARAKLMKARMPDGSIVFGLVEQKAEPLAGIFHNNARVRLRNLLATTAEERNSRIKDLMKGLPCKEWPFGMPCSASPLVVLLGISPGNSPKKGEAPINSFKSSFTAPTFGTPHGGFDYPVLYWKKVRDLGIFLVKQRPRMETLTDNQALALCSHLNLGRGQSGTAEPEVTEPAIVRWVSNLLFSKLKADLVVCFGGVGVLTDQTVLEQWNHPKGLQVDWRMPNDELPFGRYKFRLWHTLREDGHPCRVLMWPNHPSRHPFAGGASTESWQNAKRVVTEFLKSRLSGS